MKKLNTFNFFVFLVLIKIIDYRVINDYLLFEDVKIFFINGYKDKIKLTELEEYLKNN